MRLLKGNVFQIHWQKSLRGNNSLIQILIDSIFHLNDLRCSRILARDGFIEAKGRSALGYVNIPVKKPSGHLIAALGNASKSFVVFHRGERKDLCKRFIGQQEHHTYSGGKYGGRWGGRDKNFEVSFYGTMFGKRIQSTQRVGQCTAQRKRRMLAEHMGCRDIY